jgi:hypothetical protein
MVQAEQDLVGVRARNLQRGSVEVTQEGGTVKSAIGVDLSGDIG